MPRKTPRTADTILRVKAGTTFERTVRRILATWERATPSDIESGARWYSDGQALIDAWAAQFNHPRETVAAVVAALSPRTSWSRNISATVDVLNGVTPTYALRSNVARARRVLSGERLTGPKIQRFARNLTGDREAVTVDVWATRVALGDDEKGEHALILGRVGVYGAIESAYREAARRVGVDPTTMQATTWVVARNGRAD